MTEAEKTALEQSDAAWARPPQSFIDEWAVAAGTAGCYNEETGYFELNGLTDITYGEALQIMELSALCNSELEDRSSAFAKQSVRTLIPIKLGGIGNYTSSLTSGFRECPNLEVVAFGGGLVVSDLFRAFYYCPKLRKIIGSVRLAYPNVGSAFEGCLALEEVHLRELTTSINFSNSPRLNLSSIEYVVQHATNTSAITITLHPQAYARVTDEIFALAASKNITIATT